MLVQKHACNSGKREYVVKGRGLGTPVPRSILACLALVTVCALFLLTTVTVQADTVTINDQAGVLDTGRVQAEAAQLPVPVLIYTTDTFTGDQDALDQSTRAQLPDQNTIAIGIDTVNKHVSIEAGTSVQVSDSQASDAVSAFQSNYNGGDYTGATRAALDSLLYSLNNALGGSNSWWDFVPWFLVGMLIFVYLLVCIVIYEREKGRGVYGDGYGGGHGGGHGGSFGGGHGGGHGGGF